MTAMRLSSLLRRLGRVPALRRLRRDESGAALVELAVSLPLLLIIFATAVEGARLMWSFEAANTGVRDAARYLARRTPLDICSGGSIPVSDDALRDRIRNQVNGSRWFPSLITVNSAAASLSCVAGTYRVSPAPVVQVSASVSVAFPFSSVFSLAGLALAPVTATVADSNRVFGR